MSKQSDFCKERVGVGVECLGSNNCNFYDI